MTPAERGRLGGRRTLELYGREHMSNIGKLGFAALVTFAGGGRMGALRRLAARGRIQMHWSTRDLSAEQLEELEREVGLSDVKPPTRTHPCSS